MPARSALPPGSYPPAGQQPCPPWGYLSGGGDAPTAVPTAYLDVNRLTYGTERLTTPYAAMPSAFVVRARFVDWSDVDCRLVAQGLYGPTRMWEFAVERQASGIRLFISAGDDGWVGYEHSRNLGASPPLYVAASYDTAGDGTRVTGSTFTSTDGSTWTEFPNTDTSFTPFTMIDTGAEVEIGSERWGSDPKTGKVYWIDVHSGVNPAGGSLLWRFDASEWAIGATSLTDPRGRAWTLGDATAIIHL